MELNRIDPPERFLRGQPQPKRQARRRWLKRGLLRLGVVFVAPALVFLVLLMVIATRPEFQLNRILVEGNERLTHAEILDLMEKSRSSNVLTMNLNHLRQQLLRSAWIKDVEITRMLPGTLTLRITERTPVGIAVLDEPYLLAGDGTILDSFSANGNAHDWLLVRGLVDDDGVVPARLAVAGQLASQIVGHAELSQAVSEIDLTHGAESVHLHLRQPALTVLVRHDSMLERLDEIIPLTPGLMSRFEDLETLDLRFARRAFLKKSADRTTEQNATVGGELF